jgi:hypothetical protein
MWAIVSPGAWLVHRAKETSAEAGMISTNRSAAQMCVPLGQYAPHAGRPPGRVHIT